MLVHKLSKSICSTDKTLDLFIMSVTALVHFYMCAQRLALLALGRAWIMFGSRKKPKPEKCLTRSVPQNPFQLGRGEDLTQIVKGGRPRRIAPTEEVLAWKPPSLLTVLLIGK